MSSEWFFYRLWASRGLEMSYNNWQLVLGAVHQPSVQQDGWDEWPSSNINFRRGGGPTSNLMVLVMMMLLQSWQIQKWQASTALHVPACPAFDA
jgi:hypothetical protein